MDYGSYKVEKVKTGNVLALQNFVISIITKKTGQSKFKANGKFNVNRY
jgi:hypothetical protein